VAQKLGISADKIPALKEEMARVSAWLSKYAGDEVKFEIHKSIPAEVSAKLEAAQKEILSKIADKVASNPTSEELHNFIYNSAKDANVPPQKVFEAIYGLLINKQRGPRAAAFLLALDRDFVVKRLKLLA
jgi:lysyl-tRNA synthetase class 1